MNLKYLIYTLVFIIPDLVFANTWHEDFSSLTYIDTSQTTAVVNIAKQKIHTSLAIVGWQKVAGSVTDTNVVLGSGRHGAFVPARYAEFSSGGDLSSNIIRLDTSVYSELDVTEFNLASGWTLQPIGTAPLVIKSLSSVTIAGTINCSGDSGTNANSQSSFVVTGGSGRCGGGSGGNGGSTTVASETGAQFYSNSGVVSGGVGGGATSGATGGNGGGGGGAYSQIAAQSGTIVSATGGSTAGLNKQDDEFALIGGGAGGGGGGVYDQLDINQTSGAGGGGGGGVVEIIAVDGVTVSSSGSILADGGDGGASSGKSGAGGGGGGGSIWIVSGGDVTFDGVVSAIKGSGGVSNSGGSGGNGSDGRTWIVGQGGFAGGTVVEDPASLLLQIGTVQFQTGTVVVTSKAIDLENSKPNFNSAVTSKTLAGSSSLSIEFAGSHDNFVGSNSGWVTDITQISEYRYFKYRITLNSVDSTPSTVSAIDVNYDLGIRSEFKFKNTGICGQMGDNFTSASLYVILIFISYLYFRRSALPKQTKVKAG